MLTGKRPHARARRFKSGSHWLREWPRAHTSHRPSLSTRKKIFFNRGGREAEEEKAQKRRIFSFHGFIFAFISFKKKQENTRKTLNSLSPSSPELDSPSPLYEHPLHLNAQLILFSTGTAHSQQWKKKMFVLLPAREHPSTLVEYIKTPMVRREKKKEIQWSLLFLSLCESFFSPTRTLTQFPSSSVHCRELMIFLCAPSCLEWIPSNWAHLPCAFHVAGFCERVDVDEPQVGPLRIGHHERVK